MPARQDIFLNWQATNKHGWGILGFNIFSRWANDPDIRPLMRAEIKQDDVEFVDPLRLRELLPAIIASNEYCAKLKAGWMGKTRLDAIVVDALNSKLEASSVFGSTNVGRCIFEDTALKGAKKILAKYDTLLVASRWNRDLLAAATDREVALIHEGVDTSLFCPGTKSGVYDASRFYIFSGGKIEHRKGQDLTLLAFRIFSERHPDAVLVTAWHCPWTNIFPNYRGRLSAPMTVGANGMLDIKRWVTENGVDPDKVIDNGFIPNAQMPQILREMDVCLQPSRAEACTSLPVKEAMACGIPVIIANNTGMKDLVTDSNCFALTHQTPVAPYSDWELEGWGESDVEEIVAALESAYSDRENARQIGANAVRWIKENQRDWTSHARQLKSLLLSRH